MKQIPLLLAISTPLLAQQQVQQVQIFDPAGRSLATGQIGRQPSQQQPTTFDCAVDGAVTNAITGEPIPRARINLNSGGISYAAASDSAGKWSISNAACGMGQINVSRPGFLLGGAVPRNRQAMPFQPLNLASGSPVHDLRIKLTPQSVIVGKVLDDQGDPVMGAQVSVLASRVIEGRARFQPSGAGITNDLGEYRISNLPRGRYLVCARSNQNNGIQPANAATLAAENCYPGPPEAGASSAMEIPPGRESKVDFTLNQILAVHVRGTITGLPEGRGIGINLIKRGVNSDFGGNVPGAVRDGKFDFRVTPGSYMLTADYFESGKRLMARVPVDAGTSDIDNLSVHLDNGFSVSGTVRVESSSGHPAPGQINVNLRPSENVNGTGQVKWEADRTAFAINDIVPGSYRLDVFAQPPFYVKSATLAGQDMLRGEISLSQPAGPIDVILRDDGGSIEGDVIGADSQPVPSAILLLRSDGRAANANLQTGGHFKLQNLAPGDYTIYAWDDVSAVEYANPDWMRRYAGSGVPATVNPNQNTQVKLTQQLAPPQ
jgi:hypothetical protein